MHAAASSRDYGDRFLPIVDLLHLPVRRYAVASALAASAVPSLVLARGHRIEQVAEIPLVVDDGAQTLTKTRKALDLLQRLGAAPGMC